MQKGRKTRGRHSQVDILFGLDRQRPRKSDRNLDRALSMSDEGSGVTVAEGPIPPHDADTLNHRRREE